MMWTIDGIGVTAVVDQPPPTLIPGETIELQCLFDSRTEQTSYGNGPYGEIPYGGAGAAYETLKTFARYAGSFEGDVTDNQVPWFSERLREDAEIETVLVEVEPLDVTDHEGFYALVESVSDESTVTGSEGEPRRLDFDLWVVDELDRFEDKTDVRDAYQNEPI